MSDVICNRSIPGLCLLAHLSRRLIGELIVYPCSGVRRCCCRCCRSPVSNIFSSETAEPIKAEFYVEPSWEGEQKFVKEKVKTVDCSETIATCDLKVGRCRKLVESLKVCEY